MPIVTAHRLLNYIALRNMKRDFLNNNSAKRSLFDSSEASSTLKMATTATSGQQPKGIDKLNKSPGEPATTLALTEIQLVRPVSIEGYEQMEARIECHAVERTDMADSQLIMSCLPIQFEDGSRLDCRNGFTECFITGRAKRKMFETPGFPRALPPPTQSDCFHAVDIPGKGRGVVAIKDIK
ncbi:hypothetical protein Moror_12774 [Moniliophthora roreri MCA 2997]|uniref:Uncharacterized protein n=1 Tax=Moniliophthora roreri (strain MCA 2997) TaxID=1381753 RepID=V2YR52_MONRO|nr:hypothetical protein Moror_12774 [Moniliophthora roreri MCA 2997]